MAKNKIPVLTEVYKPQKTKSAAAAPLEVTPEMLATVSAQIKPALEAEVKKNLLSDMRAEMEKVRSEMVTSAAPAPSGADNQNGALKEMRAEIDALRAELQSATQTTQNLLAEQQSSSTSEGAASDMASKVASQIKPRLEAEITDFALDEVRAEVKKARGEVILSTEDYIDKVKADLKTEMPKMYQSSIDLAQVDLSEKVAQSLAEVSQTQDQLTTHQTQLINQHQSELAAAFDALHQDVGTSVQASLRDELAKAQEKAVAEHQVQLNEALDGFLQIRGEEAERTLMQQMQEYQAKIRVDYQEQLAEQLSNALETIKQRVEESTEEQSSLMDTQVGTMQQETFAKLREEFIVEKDSLFSAAVSDIKTTLVAQMTEQAETVRTDFLAKLNGELPDVEAILQGSVQAILADAIPDLENRLQSQLTTEIKQLLNTVKFVLPD